jgi:hypothetical protein
VRSHEWTDQRSLARHEAVAAKLEADAQLSTVSPRARSLAERALAIDDSLGEAHAARAFWSTPCARPGLGLAG